MKICIVIPAYNEELRIEKTLLTYYEFFQKQAQGMNFLIIVALNGCTDKTGTIVKTIKKNNPHITIIETAKAGKGLAIKAGFLTALQDKTIDIIGFVDADMATEPAYFMDLYRALDTEYDGAIASRYSKDSHIFPPRPFIKRWGSYLIYESFIKILFSLFYDDYQCGAKLFKRHVLEKIANQLSMQQWAFDVELLYLCKLYHIKVKQVPTVWYDRSGSKLKLFSGILMLWHLIKLRLNYFFTRKTP
ncbi:glycosyltransferase [bacterium]|nr:MAG: glycosyltransferase [bacterium]QQR62244.1 MAG: glycosyltransferase [bacterium]QQR63192.1 MAG: glycosyltransferase [bacterium]